MLDDFIMEPGAIAQLMPLFLRLDKEGTILSAGPTLLKLRPGEEFLGRHILDVFDIKHLHKKGAVELEKMVGALLRLEFATLPRTGLKGTMVRLEDGGFFVNLSFGIGVLQAVSDYG